MPKIKQKISLQPIVTIPIIFPPKSQRPARSSSLRPILTTLQPKKSTILKNHQNLPNLNLNQKIKNKLTQRTQLSTASRSNIVRQISARPYPSRIGSSIHRKQGLSRQQHFLRKENHLNTCFNNRKNRLKDITKQNKKIYVRINSQKSLYSSRALSQKSQSSISMSRKLSQSKMSRKSSSSNINKKNLVRKQLNKPQIKIVSQDINKIKSDQMHKFINIFVNQSSRKNSLNYIPIQSKKSSTSNQVSKNKQNQGKTLQKYKNLQKYGKLQQIVQQLSSKPKSRNSILKQRVF